MVNFLKNNWTITYSTEETHILREKGTFKLYTEGNTLGRWKLFFKDFSKLNRITLHLSILRTLTRAFILLSQIRHQSTKRTLYVTGQYVVPIFPSIFGGCSPSMGTILYLLTMAVKNKKNSILANDSPRQTLLPEIHIYINGFFSK